MAEQRLEGIKQINREKNENVALSMSMANRLSRLRKYKEVKERRTAEQLNIPKFPGMTNVPFVQLEPKRSTKKPFIKSIT